MKGEKFLEEMEQIDPELIAEAEKYGGNKSRRKKQLAVILTAAAVFLLAGTGVVIGVSQRIRREGTEETVREETEKITAGQETRQETAEQARPDGQPSSESERWETRTATAAENATETETWREKTWEEKTLPERFREFEYNGSRYSVRAAVSEERIGEKLSGVRLQGEDVYTGNMYETAGEVFHLRGVTEKAAVVLRFTEGGESFASISPDYRPSSLGAFLTEANMQELMSFPGMAYYHYFDEENRSHTVNFEGVSRDAVLSWLQKNAAAEAVDFDTVLGSAVSYMSCAVSAADFSRENVTLSFTKNGYLWTNLFDVGLAFHVGEEAVQEFERYLKENLEGYELVPAADPGFSETAAETGVETEAVVESDAVSNQTEDPVREWEDSEIPE